jgi:hypothetical protein
VGEGLLVGLLDDLDFHELGLLVERNITLKLTGYFFGSGMASTIHAQPLWGMGFLSAFLTIWIFMFVSFLMASG